MAGVDGERAEENRDQGRRRSQQPQRGELGAAGKHGRAHQRGEPGIQARLSGGDAKGGAEHEHERADGEDLAGAARPARPRQHDRAIGLNLEHEPPSCDTAAP